MWECSYLAEYPTALSIKFAVWRMTSKSSISLQCRKINVNVVEPRTSMSLLMFKKLFRFKWKFLYVALQMSDW
jgi:hypothetical protein